MISEGYLMPAREEVKEAIGAALKIFEFVRRKFSS